MVPLSGVPEELYDVTAEGLKAPLLFCPVKGCECVFTQDSLQ
ncbi:hypothetical protein KIPB_011115, partial [Kipferlia bialata]|eukprot:g11115.t1